MKAGVITFSLSDNYGAVLQTYALQKKMQDLGVEVEVYKYVDKKRYTYGCSIFGKIKFALWQFFKNSITLNKRNRLFSKFRNQYINMTKRHYHNNAELRKNPGDYDVYVSGSDQIWNPDVFLYDLSYFLDFAPKGSKKISYSSSFGKSLFNERCAGVCGALLKEYSHISVREESGVSLVKNLCGKDAFCTLDPTLLLTEKDWEGVAEKAKKKARDFKGILCYIMPGNKRVVDSIINAAQTLKKETGLPIVYTGIKEYQIFKYGIKNSDIFMSPNDFVAYFKNAEYIVTNSFHGVAFSLNFNKNFFVPVDYSLANGAALHERILSIVTKTKAENVLFSVDEEFSIKQINKKEIQISLEIERQKSIEYLIKALEV